MVTEWLHSMMLYEICVQLENTKTQLWVPGQFLAVRCCFPLSRHQELHLPNLITWPTPAETIFVTYIFFFPGNAGKDPIRVADDIINAIIDFTWKHSTPSLKKVKVVIFVTELLNVFYDSMKKREKIATSPTFQSTFSKAACKMFF